MARVVLEDESLRDGLQFEKTVLPLEEKLELFRLLVGAGVKRVQLGSFVHPKIVPQMADTDMFIQQVKEDHPGILLTGLVLNDKGLDRAIRCGLKHISLSASVSESHSQRNVRRSAREALDSVVELIKLAVSSGLKVRAGAQCAFGCVYEGAISEDKVIETACRLAAAGASELNLADTTGMANPLQVKRLVAKVKKALPDIALSLHLHDTRGLGLANMTAGYESGVAIFDVAAGGLGGCPFVKGASGNVPAEDAVNLFHEMGVDTGIDLEALCKVVDKYESLLGRSLPGRMNRVI
jgi:hydroxymethylglutaryl-CoA lyase